MLQLLLQKIGLNRIDCYRVSDIRADRMYLEFSSGSVLLQAYQEKDRSDHIRVPGTFEEVTDLLWMDFAQECDAAETGAVVVQSPVEVRIVQILGHRYLSFGRKRIMKWEPLKRTLEAFFSEERDVPLKHL